MWERIDAGLKQAFRQHPKVRELLPQTLAQVAAGTLPASTAARNLLAAQAGQARPLEEHINITSGTEP
jgi:LAO/AO transport system kinase